MILYDSITLYSIRVMERYIFSTDTILVLVFYYYTMARECTIVEKKRAH